MTPSKQSERLMPLKELAPFTPYAVGYLSLMARRGNLKVKKVRGTWYSTLEDVKAFEILMKKRKEERKKELSHRYHKKASIHRKKASEEQSEPKKKAKGNTIFDEVQKDLKAVLEEIRNKEREIRKDYREYKRVSKKTNIVASEKELQVAKEKGGEIAEKLILDLGKLLNTANQVQEGAETIEEVKIGESENPVSIPINARKEPISQNKLYDALDQATRSSKEESDLSIYPNYPNPLPFQDEYRGIEGERQKKIVTYIMVTIFVMTLAFLFVFIAFG